LRPNILIYNGNIYVLLQPVVVDVGKCRVS